MLQIRSLWSMMWIIKLEVPEKTSYNFKAFTQVGHHISYINFNISTYFFINTDYTGILFHENKPTDR